MGRSSSYVQSTKGGKKFHLSCLSCIEQANNNDFYFSFSFYSFPSVFSLKTMFENWVQFLHAYSSKKQGVWSAITIQWKVPIVD